MKNQLKIITFCTISLFFTIISLYAEDQVIDMKKYKISINQNGNICLTIKDKKVFKLALMTFNDAHRKRLYPKFNAFKPTIKIEKNRIITISYSKPGIVEKFIKTIRLSRNKIDIKVVFILDASGLILFSGGIELYPSIFNGAEYIAIDKGKETKGSLPSTAPSKPQYIYNNLGKLSKIELKTKKVGNIILSFEDFTYGLADYRAAKWSQMYKLHNTILKPIKSKKSQERITIEIN
jgi:hypothetical protein